MKKIYFVRHGQTVGNLGKFFQYPDTELSEAGHEGARAVAQRFKNIDVDMLVASHFTRAQQTAGYISEVTDVPIETSEFFHEKLHSASMLGISKESQEALLYKKEHSVQFWAKNWNPEGAENYFDVCNRIKQGIILLKESKAHNILVVSHGDFIRLMTAFLLSGQSSDIQSVKEIVHNLQLMSNVAITEFVYDDEKWKLKHWNDFAHFAE